MMGEFGLGGVPIWCLTALCMWGYLGCKRGLGFQYRILGHAASQWWMLERSLGLPASRAGSGGTNTCHPKP